MSSNGVETRAEHLERPILEGPMMERREATGLYVLPADGKRVRADAPLSTTGAGQSVHRIDDEAAAALAATRMLTAAVGTDAVQSRTRASQL